MKLKKLAAVTLNKVFSSHTYTVRHGLAKGLKRRGGLAFLPAFVTAVPKRLEEERFLFNLDLAGQTVFDVGGDQGIYTLFFASRVGPTGKVVTFEPNPQSHARVVTNIALNAFQNVDVRQLGLGAAKGKATLVFPEGDPARGSADPAIQAQILREWESRTIDIEIDSLDSLIAASTLPPPHLIKIDVEGLEMDVLRGMKETVSSLRPKLFIEVHGADARSKGDNARQIVNLLLDARYLLFHVEARQSITLANIEIARRGHLYCEPQRD